MSINEEVAFWPAFRQAAAIRNGEFSKNLRNLRGWAGQTMDCAARLACSFTP